MRAVLGLLPFLLLCQPLLAQDPPGAPGFFERARELRGEGGLHPGGGVAGGARSAYDGLPVYHNAESLVCSDCHTMHASLQHDSQGGTGADPFATGGYPWTTTPTAKLLKAPSRLDLCLACHDGQIGIPDVVGADANSLNQRAAGHFEAPDSNPHTGHNLGRVPDSLTGPWGLCMRCHFGGTFADAQVECTDCHNKHGNTRARNLQWASEPGFEPPLGLFMDPTVGASFGNLARYERANVAYGTLDSNTLREVTSICIDCHHVFSGATYTDPDGDGIHSRHPAYDSEKSGINSVAQGAVRGTTDPAHWEGGSGAGFDVDRVRYVTRGADTFAAAVAVSAVTNGAFCLSCHYAHGSAESFSLVWDEPEPSSGPRGCDQCHNKSAG